MRVHVCTRVATVLRPPRTGGPVSVGIEKLVFWSSSVLSVPPPPPLFSPPFLLPFSESFLLTWRLSPPPPQTCPGLSESVPRARTVTSGSSLPSHSFCILHFNFTFFKNNSSYFPPQRNQKHFFLFFLVTAAAAGGRTGWGESCWTGGEG